MINRCIHVGHIGPAPTQIQVIYQGRADREIVLQPCVVRFEDLVPAILGNVG